MATVRTRFAPSPTGYMHIGNLRTALYTYLIAKKHKGTFILRIEDTDRERYVEGATDVIFRTLRTCGLNWDEGPDVGGDYGPYVQSERMGMFKGYAEQLVKLEQQLANTWNETEKSRITLEINTLKTTQLENDYAIIAKENSIADIQQVLANIDVICPVDGTIRAINEDDPSLPYITIQREGAFRIKASLNELNMYSISPAAV